MFTISISIWFTERGLSRSPFVYDMDYDGTLALSERC